MDDSHGRPSPYRPTTPDGRGTLHSSWSGSSSAPFQQQPQQQRPVYYAPQHADPYHSVQQEQNAESHFYRSFPQPAAPATTNRDHFTSQTTVPGWSTALEPLPLPQSHYNTFPGPSATTSWQVRGASSNAVGGREGAESSGGYTVGDALSGIGGGAPFIPSIGGQHAAAPTNYHPRFTDPWNGASTSDSPLGTPSANFGAPSLAYYDQGSLAASSFVVPNGLPIPRPLSGDSLYSQSGSYTDVLPAAYQTYSPDPYSSSNPSRAPSATNASQSQRLPSAASAPPSVFSTDPNYSPAAAHPHARKGPPPPLQDPLPSSSSHTFNYPETYPARSLSGSSSSTAAVSPISATSTTGSAHSQPPHAAVVAAQNRIRLASASSSSSSSTSAPRKPPIVKKGSLSTRAALELAFDCRYCGIPLAKLTLRGGGTTTSGRHEGTFYCTVCVPLPPPPPAPVGGLAYEEEEATYADTLSAAVDRLEGISVEDADPRPPPANRNSAGSGGLSSSTSRKRSKGDEDCLQCDVCKRDVATGGLRLVGGREGEKFECTVEVLCTHCEGRYMRCSDCGGGGGTRGVGRWRAKELFPAGRRTCQLSHVRMGTLNDMTYDVWPITSIPPEQTPALIKMCREIYFSTLLATLAVPDMMESQGAIARSYEEVMKQATDSWTVFQPLITEDIETARSTRRYIALRWTSPASRKAKYKGKKGGGAKQEPDAPPSPPTPDMNLPPTLLRDGKVLAGFIMGECDLLLGSLHVALTMPTGSGESYDAASRLMQSLFRHVQNDIASINYARNHSRLPLLPSLKQAWSLHMIKKDSRIMSRIETRRGFLPVEDYLAKYPDANRNDFAPVRPVFLPPELLKGWHVYVKRVTEDDEWLASGHRKGSTSGRLEM